MGLLYNNIMWSNRVYHLWLVRSADYCAAVIIGGYLGGNLLDQLRCATQLIPFGLVVRIPGFHPGGPGSIPGVGKLLLFFFFSHLCLFTSIMYCIFLSL